MNRSVPPGRRKAAVFVFALLVALLVSCDSMAFGQEMTASSTSNRAKNANPNDQVNQAKAKSQVTKPTLAKVLRGASKSPVFLVPTLQELRDVERMFEATLRALPTLSVESSDITTSTVSAETKIAELTKAWSTVNMSFTTMRLRGERVLVLTESASDRRGRGMFAFRPDTETKDRPAICLQAPHSFFDQHTRSIAVRLFESGSFSTAGWNTVKRSQADLAHQRQSYFSAYTRAFAATHGTGCVVQLHGFSQEKRKTSVGAASDVVVSSGSRHPSRKARALAQQMSANFVDRMVALFPDEVRELGATKNAQGGEMRSLGHSGFLHLEMSSSFRESLRRDASTRSKLLQSILAACRI